VYKYKKIFKPGQEWHLPGREYPMANPNYDQQYIAQLFDQMGPSYDATNVVSSFGFSEMWRAQCVSNLQLTRGSVVADLMAGSGECWPYIQRHIGPRGKIIAVDISSVMCHRQKPRLDRMQIAVDSRCENALNMSLPDLSVDHVICAFGLKTFDTDQTRRFAAEVFRILRPGGTCSLLEISIPDNRLLQLAYVFYIGSCIPLIGKICLGGIDSYRMLAVYATAFGSCRRVEYLFEQAGFAVQLRSHFFGCATSLGLTKPA
jgi:demethylmenaquinone methyltransferase/2-methoxy-6-polyprenyl-1,4-benzoquinol methylase